jgi:rubrerythrin
VYRPLGEAATMTVTFNTIEVLEIAEQIERNGAQFYRRAADIFDDPNICKMFIRLAKWEAKHEQFFARMRKQLSQLNQESGPHRPEEMLPDPKVMAGLAVFGIKPDPADELGGKESDVDILRRCIEKEKDSIVFYSGLKDFVPTRAGKEKIDDIIKEEMRHIRILNRFRKTRE